MKIIRWVAVWVLGPIVALAMMGAGVLAFLVSRIDVRAEVERAVEAATGRDLTLSGDVGVSYWPVLGLHAAGATLSNVEGGKAPAFLTAEDIHVGVEFGPLLSRRVVVSRLVLQKPSIALEVDEAGRPNWLLAPRPRPGAAPQRPAPPTRPGAPAIDANQTSLRELRINQGEVSFFDARRGAGWTVGDVDLSGALTSLAEPMHVKAGVRFNDRRISLDIEVGKPGAAIRGGSTPLKLSLGSELLDARFDGQTVAASAELAGAVNASGASLRQLAAWAGVPIHGGVGLELFSVSGRLAVGGGRYDFSNASFELDLIRGRGDFVLAQHSGKPYLSGRLQLSDFDLNPYLTGQAPALPPESGEATSAQVAEAPAPARAIDVKAEPTTTPIDLSALRAFNADLELITAAVAFQHMRIENSRLNLVLHDGHLAATLQSMTLYGGSGSGRFEVDAREPALTMVQDLAFSGLDARRFLTDAANFSNIEGRAELSFSLRTRGHNQAEMIAAADGRAHLEVVGGTLHGVDLGGVSRTIRNALRGELIAPEARTPFHGFSATFAIADGVLASDDLSFNTPDLRLPGIGVIDLPARTLDARLSARSPRGIIGVPFSVRGPWTQLAYRYDGGNRAQTEILARVRQVEAASRQQ